MPDEITLSVKDFLENQASATRDLDFDAKVSFLSEMMQHANLKGTVHQNYEFVLLQGETLSGYQYQ